LWPANRGRAARRWTRSAPTRPTPALFLLSGGTTGIPNGNVYWELSGWAPRYFPPSLRTGIRGRLREKIMSGSDYPSLPYERILREWHELGYDQNVMDLVFHANAERVLGL
jgi:hypothetical protein